MQVVKGRMSYINLKLIHNTFLLLLLVGLLEPIGAAHADAPDLSSRPMTQVKNILTMFEMFKKYPEIMVGQFQTQKKLQQFTAGSAPSYDRGADFGEILTNSLHDIKQILGHYYPCWNWMIVGVCMRVSWFNISFGPYVRYRLPMHKVDNHPQDLQHHYIPKVLNRLLLPVNEMIYYNMVDTVAETSVDRAVGAVELQGGFAGYSTPNLPGFRANSAHVNALKAAIPRNKRHRGANEKHGGWTKNEYMVLPELFSSVLGQIPYSNIHKRKNASMWASDWPIGILPARWPLVSFVISPLNMINRYVFPHNCASVNSWLQGGQTPIDMLLTGNTTWDAMHLAWPSSGCLKSNNGPWVPVTNGAYTPYAAGAATIGMMKGLTTQRFFNSGGTYKMDLKRSKAQFTRNKRMPQNCGNIERYVLNFNSGNYVRDDDDPWYNVEYWKYFRGCESGYFPIVVWDGGGYSQIKE